ncbi:MAG: hypothetical protein HZB47_14415 [Nitrosomonadales bacterium]|nr:hypothetical protein [Nitrosomonadales bacterium]
MDRDSDADDDQGTPAPEGDVRAKLKIAAHYAMLGFAPVVSVLALVAALFANGNHSDPAQLSELAAQVNNLNASLAASRAELENLKFGMSREKSQRGDERRKAEEIDELVIRNVSRLQTKLKVAPTLEEQLQAAVKAPEAASAAAGAASAPVAAAPVKQHAVSAAVAAGPDKKPATAATVSANPPAAATPKPDEKKKAAPVPAPKPSPKLSPQVKALKDAIDQYNKD